MVSRIIRFPPHSSTAKNGIQPATWNSNDWLALTLLLFLAATLRLVLFNGFFGSDDTTYLQRSTEIAQGIWTSANYNGELRYGYNIPAALFIYLFGLNAFTANAWTLFCSLSEIALVYFFATRYIGTKAAVFAALILSSTPLHIALGTRIHADSVFAFFLTLAFVLFYMAEQSGKRKLYFATGLALGMIYWVKELGVITYLAFVTYPILASRLNKGWIWIIGGGLVMLAGHLTLMQIITGDPLHLIKTVTGQVQNGLIQDGYEDSTGYYFKYLFLDIKHTWIAPFLATLALAKLLPGHKKHTNEDVFIYIAWWLLSLLFVLSFTPVSLNPLHWAMKQSNYLSLFMAPIALLSGIILAKLHSRPFRNGLITVIIVGGIALGALEQHAYHVFTANSKAAVAFIKAHPDDWIVGSQNNGNVAWIISTLGGDPTLAERFGYLTPGAEPNQIKGSVKGPAVGRKPAGYAIFDLETIHWGRRSLESDIPPPCWQKVNLLAPKSNDAGYVLLRTIVALSEKFPTAIKQTIESSLLPFIDPKPATVYRVNANNLWCTAPAIGLSQELASG